MDSRPIGVLDSGVGGLTVLHEIHKELPDESTVYIGDSLHAPYGARSPEEILVFSQKLIQFLLQQQAKAIVVACNTITVNGIDKLRAVFQDIPIVGTVPVVKTAAAVTKNKKIGLLVTGATAKSTYNQELINTFAHDCEVTIVGTNKLVPLIEAGKKSSLPDMIAQELTPFKKHNVDTVILGSTHFPILRSLIESYMGEEVAVLDSGGAVARQVRRILTNNSALVHTPRPTHCLYTTGPKKEFAAVAAQIFEKTLPSVEEIVLQ